MTFPANPADGQQATINGIVYSYDAATDSWTRVAIAPTTTGGFFSYQSLQPNVVISPDRVNIWVDSDNNQQYIYVDTGPSAQWVLLGNTGATGAQGATGPAGGATGATGVQGATGPQGTPGGATGATGPQGPQGTPGGATGPQGSTGATGVPGPRGATGLMGATGTPGAAGATGAGATGATGISGNVGATGATGLGFVISKTYANVAALTADTSPTGISAGQFAVIDSGTADDVDNAKIYLWNGSTYQFITDLSGAQGITGATGATGAGATGATGIQGPQGATGAAGTNGTIGVDGATGATGPQGIQGNIGATGITGNIGSTGPTGATGIVGGVQYAVTNSGASAYLINGESNPGLTLIKGSTYYFNVAAAGHPFWIKTVATTGTGSAYTSGVTNNGVDSGTVTFTVPFDAPATLYYICQFHAGMVGTLTIANSAVGATGPIGSTGATGPQGATGPAGSGASINRAMLYTYSLLFGG